MKRTTTIEANHYGNLIVTFKEGKKTIKKFRFVNCTGNGDMLAFTVANFIKYDIIPTEAEGLIEVK